MEDGVRSACMRLSYFAPDRLDLAERAKTFGPENERASRIRLCPVETCSTVSGGKARSSAQSSWTATLLATQSRVLSTTGFAAQICIHTVKSGSTVSRA